MNIKIKKTISISIPDEYQKLKSMPDDPKDSVSFGMRTDSAECFLLIFPITHYNSMPFGDEKSVIYGIHKSLAENQGLIKVAAGTTSKDSKYIYSIVKTLMKPSGVQYTLVLHIDFGSEVLVVNAFFSEFGTTGLRDTFVYSLLGDEVSLLKDKSSWMSDPYDKNYTRGLLMNRSESEEYDAIFPNYPLSMARKFIQSVVG